MQEQNDVTTQEDRPDKEEELDDQEATDKKVVPPRNQGLPMKGESRKLFNSPGHEKAG
jgi:hypothetical protein